MKLSVLSAALSGLGVVVALPAAAPAPAPAPAPDAAPESIHYPVTLPVAVAEAEGINTLAERSLVEVTYPEATVRGVKLLGVESFRGIPFAQPPEGNLRLRPPQRVGNGTLGTIDGTGLGPSCPQMYISTGSGSPLFQFLGELTNIPMFQQATNTKEDCLTVNVQRPAGTAANAKLPVLFWIFGGGFELGTNAMYDATSILARSVSLNEPIIVVAVNYRTNGFGFLGGKEIHADGASNLGLLDQRMGLEWVADNIAAFGGDPDRVTIWGESAGAISVFDQMALYGGDHTYKGKPLFRAAIMNSGSMVPADPVDCPKAQSIYDRVVAKAGCAGKPDTLACLRSADYDTFLAAVTSVPGILSYNSVALSYLPRPDGTVLTDSPDALALSGKYAAVPMIIGDQEDEGTLFALFQANTTASTKDIVQYLGDLFFNSATNKQLTDLVNTYSPSTTSGSPFRTSIFNEFYPGFKRLAAILGDLVFTLTRRAFLTATTNINANVPSWSYLSSYNYGTPVLGTFHASDLIQTFFGILPNYAARATQTYYINFVHNLDPNEGAGNLPNWPKWSVGHKLMNFLADTSLLINDNFRESSFNQIMSNVASFHI